MRTQVARVDEGGVQGWEASIRTASTIEETVAGLDGLVDGVSADGVVDLPQTEAHEGHVMAAVELDGRRSHCSECSCCD